MFSVLDACNDPRFWALNSNSLVQATARMENGAAVKVW